MVFLWPGPRPPKPKEPTGRLFRAGAFPKFLGKIRTENPPVYLWLPLAWVAWVAAASQWIGKFGPPKTLKIPKGRVAKFWVVCGGPPNKFLEFGAQTTLAKGNRRENGGFQPRFFPRALPKDLGEKKGGFFVVSKISWTPHFSCGFPLAWPPGKFWEFWAPAK